jgi:hypothetical protein
VSHGCWGFPPDNWSINLVFVYCMKQLPNMLQYSKHSNWLNEWVSEWERERENFMINWKLYVKVYILFHFTICSARLTYTNVVTETTTTFYQRSLTISFVSQNKNNNQQHHLSSLISLNLNMKLKFLQVIWNVFFTTHYSLHFRKEVI